MILILPTGKADKQILALEDMYLKRLKKPWNVEIRDLRASKNTSPLAAKQEEETTQLAALSKRPDQAVPVLLHEHGPTLSTEAFASKVKTWLDHGQTPAFFIGGASGFSEKLLADHQKISLSPMTFPHQLCRVMLAEQLYRAYTLAVGHPYHRP